jgi:hypothetical protein
VDWQSKLLKDIDDGLLRTRTHKVARRLAEHHNFKVGLGAEVIAAFDEGNAPGDERLLKSLWDEIESLPLVEQGSLRTLVALLRPDEPLGSHQAEYLIGWAEEAGVPSSTIRAAFR